MKKALYVFGYLFLTANLVICGYTILEVQKESDHMDYVQSVFTPILAGQSYLRGCLDMGGDPGLCRYAAEEIEQETREMLKLQE
jgi:hypothetical protein